MSQDPNRILDYQRPMPRRPSNPAALRVVVRAAWSSTLVVLILTVAALGVVPRFEGIFRDFGVSLPLPTRMLLAASRSVRYAPYWWMPVWALPVGVSLLVAHAARNVDNDQARRWMRWILLLQALVLGACVALIAWALLSPMVAIMDGISSGR